MFNSTRKLLKYHLEEEWVKEQLINIQDSSLPLKNNKLFYMVLNHFVEGSLYENF